MLEKKRGISLVILVVTIMVMIILAGATIITTTTVIANARKTALAKDLTTVEDMVKAYYVENNTLPIVEESSFTKNELLAISPSYEEIFIEEMTLNEELDNTIYYEIDLAKINIVSSTRGTKADSNNNDIYVVSSNTMKVYYPLGISLPSGIYFSVTSKLIDLKEVEKEDLSVEESEITFVSRSKIEAKKNTVVYTNSLEITVDTVLETGETLSYAIGAGTSTSIETLPYVIEISIDTLSEAEIADIISGNKYITIQKNGTDYTDTVEVSISNLDISSPTVGEDEEYTSYENFNTITISDIVDTGGSEIKEARYEYVTKVNLAKEEIAYYSVPPTITENYLKISGKKSDSEVVKLPKNIKSIKLVVVDFAGNSSEIQTYEFTDLDMLEGEE